MLVVEPGVEIQMNVPSIFWFVFHEVDSAKTLFIFNRPKHLDNVNLSQINVFRELMVEDGKCENLVLKASN
jgi:hypothetical protein